MKLILDDLITSGLDEYLLTQDGIIDVSISIKNGESEVNIHFNEKTTPKIILKHINLFQGDKLPSILGFDKEYEKKIKKLNYLVKDLCCEYCYKDFIQKLFENEFVKSVFSDFDHIKPAYNIKIIIEYLENYSEIEMIEYIKENL